MDFFNSLTLDLRLLVVGIAGCALLALFSGNHKSERRYLVALSLLAAVGIYRFTHTALVDHGQGTVVETLSPHAVTVAPKNLRQ